MKSSCRCRKSGCIGSVRLARLCCHRAFLAAEGECGPQSSMSAVSHSSVAQTPSLLALLNTPCHSLVAGLQDRIRWVDSTGATGRPPAYASAAHLAGRRVFACRFVPLTGYPRWTSVASIGCKLPLLQPRCSPQRVRLALRYRPRDSPRPSLELSALLLPLRGLRPQQSHAGRRSSCCARCMAEAPLRGMTVAQPLEMQRAAPCSRIASAWS